MPAAGLTSHRPLARFRPEAETSYAMIEARPVKTPAEIEADLYHHKAMNAWGIADALRAVAAGCVVIFWSGAVLAICAGVGIAFIYAAKG